jgi:hypothetical protein
MEEFLRHTKKKQSINVFSLFDSCVLGVEDIRRKLGSVENIRGVIEPWLSNYMKKTIE